MKIPVLLEKSNLIEKFLFFVQLSMWFNEAVF